MSKRSLREHLLAVHMADVTPISQRKPSLDLLWYMFWFLVGVGLGRMI